MNYADQISKPPNHREQTFNQDTFWPAFYQDLAKARALVLIQSAFISVRRIRQLAYVIAPLIQRNVRICIFAQDPSYALNEDKLRQFQAAVQLLESMGIHVTLRKLIHEKLAVIDQDILWDGSLNILSYLNTKERMRRWRDRTEVEQAIVDHGLESCSGCLALYYEYGIKFDRNSLRISNHQPWGRPILCARVRLGLSQRQLAQKVGLNQRFVSETETGRRNPRIDSLAQVAKGVGLEVVLVPRFLVPAFAQLMHLVNSDDHA